MSSDHRTLGKLYPKSQDPKELAERLTEHARQHEFQLQTNIGAAGRFKSLEENVDKLEKKDTAIDTKLQDIAVMLGKLKGAMWAIGVLWTLLMGIAVIANLALRASGK